MRPSKLTQQVIDAFEQVLNHRHNAIVCTDWELCFLVNDLLPEEAQFSYRSFQRYKAEAMKGLHQEPEVVEDDTTDRTLVEQYELDVLKPEQRSPQQLYLLKQLHSLWCKAVVHQKNNLMDQMLEAKQGWQRFKWILERKYNDWHPRFTQIDPDEIIKNSKRFVRFYGNEIDGITEVEVPDGRSYYDKKYLAKYLQSGQRLEDLK